MSRVEKSKSQKLEGYQIPEYFISAPAISVEGEIKLGNYIKVKLLQKDLFTKKKLLEGKLCYIDGVTYGIAISQKEIKFVSII